MQNFRPNDDGVLTAGGIEGRKVDVLRDVESPKRFSDWLTPGRAATMAFCAAVLASYFVLFVCRPLLGIDRPLGGESYDGYLELAQNLVAGNGYVFERGGHIVFHRPPLYPALLIPGVLLPEEFWRSYVIFLNSGIFAVTSVLLLGFGQQLFGRRAATAAWLIFVGNPFILFSLKNAVPAICQVFSFVALLWISWTFWCSAKARENVSLRLVLGFSISAVLGLFSHGTMLAIIVLILGLLAAATVARRWWSAVPRLAEMVLLTALFALPWTWRNYHVTGLFMPVTGNAGFAYFAGNAHWGITLPAAGPNEEYHKAELRHAGLSLSEPVRYYGLTNPEAEKQANKAFSRHLVEHPTDFCRKVLLNGAEFYWPLAYYLFPPANSDLAATPVRERIARVWIDIVPQTIYNLVLVIWAILAAFRLKRVATERAFFLVAGWFIAILPYLPFCTFLHGGRSYYPFCTYPIIALLIAASATLERDTMISG